MNRHRQLMMTKRAQRFQLLITIALSALWSLTARAQHFVGDSRAVFCTAGGSFTGVTIQDPEDGRATERRVRLDVCCTTSVFVEGWGTERTDNGGCVQLGDVEAAVNVSSSSWAPGARCADGSVITDAAISHETSTHGILSVHVQCTPAADIETALLDHLAVSFTTTGVDYIVAFRRALPYSSANDVVAEAVTPAGGSVGVTEAALSCSGGTPAGQYVQVDLQCLGVARDFCFCAVDGLRCGFAGKDALAPLGFVDSALLERIVAGEAAPWCVDGDVVEGWNLVLDKNTGMCKSLDIGQAQTEDVACDAKAHAQRWRRSGQALESAVQPGKCLSTVEAEVQLLDCEVVEAGPADGRTAEDGEAAGGAMDMASLELLPLSDPLGTWSDDASAAASIVNTLGGNLKAVSLQAPEAASRAVAGRIRHMLGHCTTDGLVCNGNGRIVVMDAGAMQLRRPAFAEGGANSVLRLAFGLPWLVSVSITDVAVEGTLPAGDKPPLPSLLRSVDLSGTNLTGVLPAAWPAIAPITLLDVSNTSVYGPIPLAWIAPSNPAARAPMKVVVAGVHGAPEELPPLCLPVPDALAATNTNPRVLVEGQPVAGALRTCDRFVRWTASLDGAIACAISTACSTASNTSHELSTRIDAVDISGANGFVLGVSCAAECGSAGGAGDVTPLPGAVSGLPGAKQRSLQSELTEAHVWFVTLGLNASDVAGEAVLQQLFPEVLTRDDVAHASVTWEVPPGTLGGEVGAGITATAVSGLDRDGLLQHPVVRVLTLVVLVVILLLVIALAVCICRRSAPYVVCCDNSLRVTHGKRSGRGREAAQHTNGFDSHTVLLPHTAVPPSPTTGSLEKGKSGVSTSTQGGREGGVTATSSGGSPATATALAPSPLADMPSSVLMTDDFTNEGATVPDGSRMGQVSGFMDAAAAARAVFGEESQTTCDESVTRTGWMQELGIVPPTSAWAGQPTDAPADQRPTPRGPRGAGTPETITPAMSRDPESIAMPTHPLIPHAPSTLPTRELSPQPTATGTETTSRLLRDAERVIADAHAGGPEEESGYVSSTVPLPPIRPAGIQCDVSKVPNLVPMATVVPDVRSAFDNLPGNANDVSDEHCGNTITASASTTASGIPSVRRRLTSAAWYFRPSWSASSKRGTSRQPSRVPLPSGPESGRAIAPPPGALVPSSSAARAAGPERLMHAPFDKVQTWLGWGVSASSRASTAAERAAAAAELMDDSSATFSVSHTAHIVVDFDESVTAVKGVLPPGFALSAAFEELLVSADTGNPSSQGVCRRHHLLAGGSTVGGVLICKSGAQRDELVRRTAATNVFPPRLSLVPANVAPLLVFSYSSTLAHWFERTEDSAPPRETSLHGSVTLLLELCRVLEVLHLAGYTTGGLRPEQFVKPGAVPRHPLWALSCVHSMVQQGANTDCHQLDMFWCAPEEAHMVCTELGGFGEPPVADSSSDMFSFGLIAYQIVTGHSFWRGLNKQEVADALLGRRSMPVPQTEGHRSPLLDIVMPLLKHSPAARPLAGEIVAALRRLCPSAVFVSNTYFGPALSPPTSTAEDTCLSYDPSSPTRLSRVSTPTRPSPGFSTNRRHLHAMETQLLAFSLMLVEPPQGAQTAVPAGAPVSWDQPVGEPPAFLLNPSNPVPERLLVVLRVGLSAAAVGGDFPVSAVGLLSWECGSEEGQEERCGLGDVAVLSMEPVSTGSALLFVGTWSPGPVDEWRAAVEERRDLDLNLVLQVDGLEDNVQVSNTFSFALGTADQHSQPLSDGADAEDLAQLADVAGVYFEAHVPLAKSVYTTDDAL